MDNVGIVVSDLNGAIAFLITVKNCNHSEK